MRRLQYQRPCQQLSIENDTALRVAGPHLRITGRRCCSRGGDKLGKDVIESPGAGGSQFVPFVLSLSLAPPDTVRVRRAITIASTYLLFIWFYATLAY